MNTLDCRAQAIQEIEEAQLKVLEKHLILCLFLDLCNGIRALSWLEENFSQQCSLQEIYLLHFIILQPICKEEYPLLQTNILSDFTLLALDHTPPHHHSWALGRHSATRYPHCCPANKAIMSSLRSIL